MILTLDRRIQEVGDVVSFVFKSDDLREWLPGQYINITMPDVPPAIADRLFSIASAPFEDEVRVTTYISGSPFKQKLNSLRPGAQIEYDQLGGDFVWQDEGLKKLFVAGGIGSSPFRSIVVDRVNAKAPLDTTMVYVGSVSKKPFTDDFIRVGVDDKSFRLIDSDKRVDAEWLVSQVPDTSSRLVYLAGSQSFCEGLGQGLIELGHDRELIKYDYFDGYDSLE